MVTLLDLTDTTKILEIGPGAGALTTVLEQSPHAVLLLLEKDNFWARDRQNTAAPKTQCLLQDALTFDFSRITDGWTVVGNLPYNIASPLIWDCVEKASFTQALFMVQKEVADRLTAVPGSKKYGALSVWVQSFALTRSCFTVKPQAFMPPPKVDSGVVLFLPKSQKPDPTIHQALKQLIHLCFQKRRKQIGTILRQARIDDAKAILSQASVCETARPEELSPETFQNLAYLLRNVLTDCTKVG